MRVETDPITDLIIGYDSGSWYKEHMLFLSFPKKICYFFKVVLYLFCTIPINPRSPRGGHFDPPPRFFFRQKKTARRSKKSLGIIILKYIPRVLAKTAKKNFNKCGCSTVSK